MLDPWLERTERLIGTPALNRLRTSLVVVFGLGGVGSYCAEALARSGVGALRIVDHDVIADTNRNRQVQAMSSTLGRPKALVLAERLRDIAPHARIDSVREFFASETADALLAGPPDHVVDAIDALGPKVELLAQCRDRLIPVVTALGAAARLDPTRLRVAPLGATHGDPLAARVRKMLRRRGGLHGITAVFSDEAPSATAAGGWREMTDDLARGRQRVIQPSMVMVPAAVGMTAASVVIRRLAQLAAP
ncbi:MAG: tRNA threonylcarbamoyladenosine dehydratase [Polyangiaceae bacterium]|jgi:tRNA A37 threonylcarbamoyladenosine dehydratase|nr:tRNA threonylcarbamoyladenosine dehydratase [Polyangiaceae bacterium]